MFTTQQATYVRELLEDEVDKHDLNVFGAEQDMQHKYERIRERGKRRLPEAQRKLALAQETLQAFVKEYFPK